MSKRSKSRFTVRIVETITYTLVVNAVSAHDAVIQANERIDFEGAELTDDLYRCADIERSEAQILGEGR